MHRSRPPEQTFSGAVCRFELPHELTRTLAEISYQRRDYQRALELLEEAGQKEPLQANDLYYLGMCFLQTKDVDHARASLNQALAGGLRDPFATEAAKTLQQIKQ